jgi:hypothetical protein
MDMNGNRVLYVSGLLILIISAYAINQNTLITALNSSKDVLTAQNIELETRIEALEEERTSLIESLKNLNASFITFQNEVNAMDETASNTYARVIEANKKLTYTFETNTSYSYTVNYSFPEPTEVVFSVLDIDKETVLGYETLILEGDGSEVVFVTITVPDEPDRWIICPSVHWLEGGIPQYSEGWYKNAILTVTSGSEGHTAGTCGEVSTACHSG